MTTSTEISNRFWNLPQKADEETARETTYIDDIIQKSHIEKEILSKLHDVKTVFDGGAGYGRFSILLAKRGLHVTHFDISEVMIDKAKEIARREGVYDNMTFVHGSLENLDQYADGQFDLVLSFDAPISYTYPQHEKVIGNLIRIASKRVIMSVYSRLAWTYLFDPAQKQKYILNSDTTDPYARWTLDHTAALLASYSPDMTAIKAFYPTGLMELPEETAKAYEQGGTPWPVSYAFMPDELVSIMQKYNTGHIKLAGPGALSRSIPHEVLINIMHNEPLKTEFLDFCFWYDSQCWCTGMVDAPHS